MTAPAIPRRSPGPTPEAFRASSAFARALIGPRHGGRRTAAIHDILMRAIASRQRHWRWVALRATEDDLDAHLLPAWHEQCDPSFAAWHEKERRYEIGFDLGGRGSCDIDVIFLALDRVPGLGACRNDQDVAGNERARRQVARAIRALGGAGSVAASCAWHVLGLEWSLREWSQKALRGKVDQAAGVLVAALAILDPHFGT